MNALHKPNFKLLSAISVVVFLLLWEFVGRTGKVSTTFFPEPSKILTSMLSLIKSGELASATGATLLRFAGVRQINKV